MTNPTTFSVSADTKEVERIGKALMEGALLTLGKWVLIALAVMAIFAAVSSEFGWGFDGTDDLERGKRSSLSLRTDYGTGCQYLETGSGHLTPRLLPDGKQWCAGRD